MTATCASSWRSSALQLDSDATGPRSDCRWQPSRYSRRALNVRSVPVCLVLTAFAVVAYRAAPNVATAQPAASPASDAEQAAQDELNKQLNNPVSTICHSCASEGRAVQIKDRPCA